MSTLKDLSDAMANAVQATSPSLVQVNGRDRLAATGIVYSADGYIVASHHAVEREDNITVTLHDGTTHPATLVGRDPQNDIALLKVESKLTQAQWGADDSLKVGHLVLALGRPSEQVQATLGVVSAIVKGAVRAEREERRRHHRRGGRRAMQVLVDGYIQTDVVMYPGFSGGALVSGDGLIHGLNTSGFGRGVSVTVPAATIRRSVETLKQHGKVKQGYLGIGLQPVRLPEAVAKSLEQETGLLIVSVESGSPAGQGGLFVGDIVVVFDQEPVEQLDELLGLLVGDRVGKAVPVQIVRGGELKDLTVTVGERG